MHISWTRTLSTILVLLMLGDFVARGLVPAFSPGKNDFSDPYVGAWLWRHHQNPYDSNLASAAAGQLTHSHVPVVPIYPPTTFVLVAPLTGLSWNWANFVWALLGICGVALVAFAMVRMALMNVENDLSWLIVALVFSFAPFHTSIHVANPAVIAIALCFLTIYFANDGRDLAGGIALAIATGLKPQLGVWIFVFYLFRKRWKLFCVAAVAGLLLTGIALVRIPVPLGTLLNDYSANLRYWFGPGGQNDFSASNPLHFQLVNLQVVLVALLGSSHSANLVAYAIFAVGVAIWILSVSRSRSFSGTLALAALLALSFLPIYHRVYDVGVLMLAVPWALENVGTRLRWASRTALAGLLIFLAPGQALLVRFEPYIPSWLAVSWWWNVIVAPHAVWAIFLLNGVLLYSLVVSARINRSAELPLRFRNSRSHAISSHLSVGAPESEAG